MGGVSPFAAGYTHADIAAEVQQVIRSLTGEEWPAPATLVQPPASWGASSSWAWAAPGQSSLAA